MLEVNSQPDTPPNSDVGQGVMLAAKEIRKHYGLLKALDGCSLQVNKNEVFGLLGPNGAGKTTFIRTLLGFLRPTSGQAWIDGWDCFRESIRVRRSVAYLPAEGELFRSLRGRDALTFFASIHPEGSVERALQIAERFELDLSRKVGYMSTGMRQKLALSVVLANRTPFLILDEPTANLDPTTRATVLQLVREAKQGGRTVLFSSHVLSEIEEVCDRAAIMNSGRVVETVDLHQLRTVHRISGRLRSNHPDFRSNLPKDIELVLQDSHQLVMHVQGPLENVLHWLASQSFEELKMEPIRLRQVYDRMLWDTKA